MVNLKNAFLTSLVLLAFTFETHAKARVPANEADRNNCLSAVSEAFKSKFEPLHQMLKIEERDLSRKDYQELSAQRASLLITKSSAIKACQDDKQNKNVSKIVQSIK